MTCCNSQNIQTLTEELYTTQSQIKHLRKFNRRISELMKYRVLQIQSGLGTHKNSYIPKNNQYCPNCDDHSHMLSTCYYKTQMYWQNFRNYDCTQNFRYSIVTYFSYNKFPKRKPKWSKNHFFYQNGNKEIVFKTYITI